MDQKAYKDLVGKYSRLAADNPGAYRSSVKQWLALGSLFYVFVLAAALALTCAGIAMVAGGHAGSGGIRLLIIGGLVVFGLVSALFVRIEPPTGRVVTKAEAPGLFSEIERIRSALHIPPIKSVVIVPDYNAFASMSTTFGPFGKQLHLGIGMDLLVALEKYQAIAVIGHELGHHAHGHTSVGARAARVFLMWETIVKRLARTRQLSGQVLLSFCNWYLPRLGAVTSASRKAHEFEADAVAARATSVDAAAGGLVRMRVDHLSRLPQVEREIDRSCLRLDKPMQDVSRLLEHAVAEPPSETVVTDLANQLKLRSYLTDSHPSLSERLESLGLTVDPNDLGQVGDLVARFAGPLTEPAGPALLGASYRSILGEFDRKWAGMIAYTWNQRKSELGESQKTLASAEATAFQRGMAAWAVSGPEESWPLLQQAVESNPDDAETLFQAGRCALDCGNLIGVAYLEKASETPVWKLAALERLYEHFKAQGDQERVESLRVKLEQAAQAQEALEDASNQVKKTDVLRPWASDLKDAVDLEKLESNFRHLRKILAFKRSLDQMKAPPQDGFVFYFSLPAFIVNLEEFREQQANALRPFVHVDSSAICIVLTEKDKAARWLTDRKDLVVWERGQKR